MSRVYRARGRVFTAFWESTCPACEGPILRGHQVRYTQVGDVVHASCVDPYGDRGID